MEETSISEWAESIGTPTQAGEPQFVLRAASRSDAPVLANLQARVHNQGWSVEVWQREVSRRESSVWTVEPGEGNEPIAALVVWRVIDAIEIVEIVVDEEFRRRGIAVAMITSMIAVAGVNGVGRIVLEVRESNRSAIALYGKLGFVVVQRLEEFYDDGESAWKMVCVIQQG